MISGPQTAGNGVAGNPMYDSQDPSSDASRIIAFGLRNPFRFTFRPGTSEPWVGDVGWNTWEEVNRMTSTTPASPVTFGWPCYEGVGRMSSYDSANLTICENLYTDTVHPATGPYYAYQHGVSVVSGDACPLNSGSVISGITFYAEGSYPGSYNGALFFGDHSRNCIWAMMPAGNGLPNAGNLQAFVVDPNSHPWTWRPTPPLVTCSTPTSTAGRSAASSTSRPTTRRAQWPPPTRPAARRRSPCNSLRVSVMLFM